MTWTIAFDPEQRLCGCVLIQATMGATIPDAKIDALPWALAPTPGMRLFRVDEDQLAKLHVLCEAR